MNLRSISRRSPCVFRRAYCLLILLLLITVSLVYYHNRRTALLIERDVTKCLVYDRPMRTGSTTTTTAINGCLSSQTWTQEGHLIGNKRPLAIRRTLNKGKSTRYAVIKGHIWISDDDISLLRARCDYVMYITACAPLWQQLWSAAKMLSNTRRNGNTTLDAQGMEKALDWLREHAEGYARMYEAYPFIKLLEPLGKERSGRYPDLPPSFERQVISQPFEPDFVVRKEHIDEDLPVLLRALGCDDEIPAPKNVHEVVEHRDGEPLEKVVKEAAGVGDGETYKRLMEQAKLNEQGAQRIHTIMQL